MGTNVIERLTVEIAANGAQLQAEIAKGNAALKGFQQTADDVGAGANAISQRYTQAATGVANAIAQMANASRVGTSSLREIGQEALSLASLLGPQGALVGSVGIALLAVTTLFEQTESRAAEAVKKIKPTLDELEHRNDIRGITNFAKGLFEGSQEKDFADGLKALRKQREDLGRQIAELQRNPDAVRQAKAIADVLADPFSKAKAGSVGDAPLGGLLTKLQKQRKQVTEEIDALEAQITEAMRRVNKAATGQEDTGTAGPPAIKSTTQSVEAVKAQAAAAQAALRELEQGFADLFGKASSSEFSLTEFDKGVRELGDRFGQTTNQTAEFKGRLKELNETAAKVRVGLDALRADKATAEFEKLRDALLPESFKSFASTIAAMRNELAQRNIVGDQADELVRLAELADTSKKALDGLDQRLATIGESGLKPLEKSNLIFKEQQDLEAQLVGLSGKRGTEADLERARINAGLLKVQQAFSKLAAENTQNLQGAQVAGDGMAESLAKAANVAFGLGTALLGSEHTLVRMIGGVSQIASGFSDVAKLAKEAGGWAKLIAKDGGIASALPGVGAIIGGVGGIAGALLSAGQESPEARALRESIERNSERLKELASGLVELKISLGGNKLAAIRDTPIRSLSAAVSQAQGRNTGAVGASITSIVRSQFLDDLKKLGVGLSDLREAAQEFSISLSESPTVDELHKLQDAIKTFSLEQLTKTLGGQLHLLQLQAQIDPDAFAGVNGILAKLRLFADADKGVPAIANVLKGIDVTTVEGRTQAIDRLRDLLSHVKDIGKDIGQLGSLNPDEFLQAIVELVGQLQAEQPKVQTAAERFSDGFDALSAVFDAGALTAAQRFEQVRGLFETQFPQLFADLDFSSFDAFKESLGAIVAGFAADSALSDAEKAQLEALTKLRDAYQGATAEVQKNKDAVDSLSLKNRFRGKDNAAELQDLLAGFAQRAKPKFDPTGGGADALGGITGVDTVARDITQFVAKFNLTTKAGVDAFRDAVKRAFDAAAVDGISGEEEKFFNALGDILDLAQGAVNDVAAQADAAAATARQARQKILDGAETTIKVNDVTDPVAQLKLRVEAFTEAFPALASTFDDFNVVTQDGRDALEAWIRQMVGSPDALQQMADAMGVSVDELVASFLSLEDSADAAATHVQTLSDKLHDAFDAADFETEVEGITDPLEKLKRTSSSVGKVLPQVADIFKQFNVNTKEGRAGAEAALIALGKSTSDADVREAVLKLLAQIRNVPATTGDTFGDGTGASGSASSSANLASAASITEVTANRLVDLFGRNVAATESIRDLLSASLSRALVVPPNIAPPALPTLFGGLSALGAGAGNSGIALTVNLPPIVFNGPVTTADADALSRLIQQRFLEIANETFTNELLLAIRRAGLARSN